MLFLSVIGTSWLLLFFGRNSSEISSLLNATYSIRSSAVHDGILKDSYKVNGRGKLRPSIIMDETFPILRDCLVKIIEKNGLTKDDYEELFFS